MAHLSLILHIHTDHVTDAGFAWLCNHEREFPIAIYYTEAVDGVFVHVDDLVNLMDRNTVPQRVLDVLDFAEVMDAKWLRIDDNGQRLSESELSYDGS